MAVAAVAVGVALLLPQPLHAVDINSANLGQLFDAEIDEVHPLFEITDDEAGSLIGGQPVLGEVLTANEGDAGGDCGLRRACGSM